MSYRRYTINWEKAYEALQLYKGSLKSFYDTEL